MTKVRYVTVFGVLAVRLHAFAGYSGVVLFAIPYCAVYCASVYLLSMNAQEKDMVNAIGRKLLRR